ncbi:MAG: metal ABC transporter permease [Kiritimatiellia bacterium]|nr:metal ABC transporter permease [Kiritimatiellia bacterium]
MNGLDLFRQFPEAVYAGLLIAVTCGVLGVFVILKRVVFIGITLSETAVCGMALSFLLHIHPVVGAMALTLVGVAMLAYPFEGSRLPRDTILGLLFLIATAGAILFVSHSGFGLMEIKALLYGDLILTSRADLLVLAAILAPVALAQLLFLRPILNTFLDRDAARVMGLHVRFWETLFFVGLGLTISVASKVAGAGLVFCYLIAPPATALLLTRRLGPALALAALVGIIATLGGMAVSFRYDLPTNQTIIAVAVGLAASVGAARVFVRGG